MQTIMGFDFVDTYSELAAALEAIIAGTETAGMAGCWVKQKWPCDGRVFMFGCLGGWGANSPPGIGIDVLIAFGMFRLLVSEAIGRGQ